MFGLGKNDKVIAGLTAQVGVLDKTVGVLMTQIEEYSRFTRDEGSGYAGHAQQVSAILQRYRGGAPWGNIMVQRLVNLRVAFSMPNRLFMIKNPNTTESDDVANNAKKFLTDFLKVNNLDGSAPRDFAKEMEFRGQILVRLVWDSTLKLPILEYYPWGNDGNTVNNVTLNSYTVAPIEEEKFRIAPKLKAILKINGEEKVFSEDEFCFLSFNDELARYEGYPTCGPIIKILENLEKDMMEWRVLNFLYAHPTPHFKCETQEQAEAINNMIKATGWRVGTALATSGDFELKGPSGTEANMLMQSITTGAKLVSAHTGIGIHFLGFANVMSNRATASSMGEPTQVVLKSEETSYLTFYRELFTKAIRMRNNNLNREFPEDVILPKVVSITDRQWEVVKDIYLPARKDGLISSELFLDAIPGVDVEAEQARIDEEEKKNEEKQQKEFDRQAEISKQNNQQKDNSSKQNGKE
jgi:hypothetical protein